MEWIDGFVQPGGQLELEVLSESGLKRHISLRQMRSAAPKRRGARRVELPHVNFEHFIEVSSAEYAKLLGFPREVSARHAVYELRSDKVRLLIPAAVMMLAFFGRMCQVGSWLLSPASLERLAVPYCEREPSVTFFPGSLTGGRDLAATQNRFLWLTCFPSARRLWNSVHQNALSGRLALDLPRALASMSAIGLSRGDTILVTRVLVNNIQPTELPHECGLRLAGATFVVSSKNGPKQNRNGLRDCELLQGVRGWQMSNAEWQQVSALLPPKSHMATARARMDEVLLKLGTGRPWNSVSKSCAARQMYFRSVREGRWEQVLNVLLGHRRSVAPKTISEWVDQPDRSIITIPLTPRR